ncbi:MAG: FMN-binding protein [Gemmatimonadetes bacterium]|nr:FMN-binding protein [Gemmatimonadota bacterium]
MSEDIRKGGAPPGSGEDEARDLPDREEVMPKDHDLYTPQGGGSGTGAGPIREVAAVGDLRSDAASTGPRGVPLPLAGPEIATAEALGLTVEDGGVADGRGFPDRPEVSSFRLLMTLGLAGAVAGALLVFVFLWSDPLIKAEQARVLREAVTEVLKGPERFESVFVVDGELTTQIPAGVDTLDLDKVFLGYDASGSPVGFAMVHARFGFQDLVTVIFGYDPEARQVLGMKVLDHSETPGLGNKIEEMPFVGEFNGVDAPIEGVKPDRNTGAPNQVDMITSVTISSRAVIRTINERIEQLGDLLAAYEIPPITAGADPSSTSGGGEDR